MSRNLVPAVLCLCLFAGCVTPPTEVPEAPPPENGASELPQGSEVVSESLTRIAIGTPESLEIAFLDLGLSEVRDSSRAIELQNLALSMFELLYPLLNPPGTPAAPFSPASEYPALFQAVRNGEFPTVAQEDVSFLTLIIPPLAVLATEDQTIAARSREALEQAESVNPDSIIPDLLLGIIAAREERFDEAERRLGEVAEESERCYPARVWLSRVALEAEEYSVALGYLDPLRAELPPSVEILELSAKAYFRAGEIATADLLIQEALKLASDDPLLLLLRIQILVADRKFARAGNLLNIVERRRPNDPDVLLVKSEILANDGDLAGALSEIERAREIEPENEEIRDAYGRLLVRSGEIDAGKEILESSLDASPENETNLRVLLESAVSGEQWEDAASYLDRLIAVSPEREYLDQAVDIQIRLGNITQAAEYARRRYELDTQRMESLKQYVELLIEIGADAKADELLVSGISSTTNSEYVSDFLYLRSRLTDDVDARKRLLGEALFSNRNNFKAIVAYSQLFEEQGDIRRARFYLQQAAVLRPEDQEIKQKLEDLLRKEGGN